MRMGKPGKASTERETYTPTSLLIPTQNTSRCRHPGASKESTRTWGEDPPSSADLALSDAPDSAPSRRPLPSPHTRHTVAAGTQPQHQKHACA